jgi:hypothetical protein
MSRGRSVEPGWSARVSRPRRWAWWSQRERPRGFQPRAWKLCSSNMVKTEMLPRVRGHGHLYRQNGLQGGASHSAFIVMRIEPDDNVASVATVDQADAEEPE